MEAIISNGQLAIIVVIVGSISFWIYKNFKQIQQDISAKISEQFRQKEEFNTRLNKIEIAMKDESIARSKEISDVKNELDKRIRSLETGITSLDIKMENVIDTLDKIESMINKFTKDKN